LPVPGGRGVRAERAIMRNVGGLPVNGPVRTYRHEYAEWDREPGAWKPPSGVTIVTFRPDGQVIESQTHLHDGSIARRACAYDDEGRLVDEQSWTNDSETHHVLHAYDAAGRPTVRTHVAPDGTRREGETFTYDQAGHRTLTVVLPDLRTSGLDGSIGVGIGLGEDDVDEGVFYDANQRLMHRVTRSRDQEGRVLREVVELGGETPFGDFHGGLDEVPVEERARMAGLVAQVFADRTFASVEYAYDGKGRILQRTTRMGSLSEERTIYHYGDRDDPIEEISEHHSRRANLDEGGLVHTSEDAPQRHHSRFEYVYDDHGNWTERIVSVRSDSLPGFERTGITRRTLTYFGEEPPV
jgi:hypothetical protein